MGAHIIAQVSTLLSFPSIMAGIGIFGAIFAAIVAYRKAKPEATAIIVDAAKDIVILQKGELARLQESLSTAHRQILLLEKENKILMAQVEKDAKRIRELELRLDAIDKSTHHG